MAEEIEKLKRRLVAACQDGEIDVIDSVLADGVDLNFHYDSKSPLQWACEVTEPWVIDVVTKLLEHGADVDLIDENDETALDRCLAQDPFQEHVAQLLLDCSKLGVNRMFPNNSNYLCFAHSVDAIKFLVKNGIDINNVYAHGEDPCTELDQLSDYYHSDDPCVEYLVSIGAKKYEEL